MGRQGPQTHVDIGGIDVIVTRKRVKNINLRVGRDGQMRASAPFRESDERIMRFLAEHEDWMRRALERRGEALSSASRKWATGETVHLWGRELRLAVIPIEGWKRPKASVEGDALHMTLSPADATPETADLRRKLYLEMLARELKEALPGIVLRCEAIVGEHASNWSVRHMTSRWGSCTPTTRRIRLNSELAAYEPLCADYVAIHELCHLLVPNHGPEFHALMDKHCPGWEELRARLRHIAS